MAGRADGFYWVRLGTRWRVAEYEEGTWYSTKWSQGGAEDAPDIWDEIGPRILSPGEPDKALAAIGSGTQGRDAVIEALQEHADQASDFASQRHIKWEEGEGSNEAYEEAETIAMVWNQAVDVARDALASPEKVTTNCPYCGQPVETQWTKNGCIQSTEYTLVADWVYHTVCWDKQVAEHPHEKVIAPELAEVDEAIERLRRSVEPTPAVAGQTLPPYIVHKTPPVASDLPENDFVRAQRLAHALTIVDYPMHERIAAEFADIRAEAKAAGFENGWYHAGGHPDDMKEWLAANRPSPTGQDQE